MRRLSGRIRSAPADVPDAAGDGAGTHIRPAIQVNMSDERIFRAEDGREWIVSLEAPGKLLAVPPSLERSGANLPEHQIRIVFTSGEESISEEYTAFTALEDLSDSDLQEWLDAARRGHGV
jgi:hypothetical protein